MCGDLAKAWMFGVCAQHWPALVAQVLLSQLNSLSPQPWSSVLQGAVREKRAAGQAAARVRATVTRRRYWQVTKAAAQQREAAAAHRRVSTFGLAGGATAPPTPSVVARTARARCMAVPRVPLVMVVAVLSREYVLRASLLSNFVILTCVYVYNEAVICTVVSWTE